MKYKDFKMLSKDDMKHIMGGSAPDAPPPGFVGQDGAGCYKCCWTGGSQSCSSCVLSYAGAPCVEGAQLVGCGNLCA